MSGLGGAGIIDRDIFADKQMELAAEFAQFIVDHPEADEKIPDGAFIYFQIDGEPEFNRYARKLASRQRRDEGVPIVFVRIKGLAAPQGSRLIDPVIEASSAIA